MNEAYFYDTSALLKIYHKEAGTEEAEEYYLDTEKQIYISEVSRIEFISSLHRKYREKEISESAFTIALQKFKNDCVNRFNVETSTSSILKKAEELIEKYAKEKSLRTLDSIQLASFLFIAEEDTFFICADKKLNEVVISEGYKIINPITRDHK